MGGKGRGVAELGGDGCFWGVVLGRIKKNLKTTKGSEKFFTG